MSSSDPQRPNFLIIIADDLGFSDLGCFGGEIHTPNLDRLGYEGTRSTGFHAAAACSPTRAMLLTGTDHHLVGLGQLIEFTREHPTHQGKPGHEGYLNDNVVTLPQLLRDNGYLTLLSGKWHLGLLPEYAPCSRGFEKSYAFLPGCGNHYGWEPQLENAKDLPRLFESVVCSLHIEDDQYVDKVPEDFYSSDFYASKLIDYFKDRQESKEKKPFFAYLSFTAPHWPLQAPRESVAHYKGVYDDGPDALRQRRLQRLKELGMIPEDVVAHPVVAPESKEWTDLTPQEQQKSSRAMEVYSGMVERLDWNVGRVIDYLESVDELDNTVVIFMSDNGAEGASFEARPVVSGSIPEHIEKYYDNSLDNIGNYNSYVWYGTRWAQAATAPSRLYKMYSSEGGIRVPLIVRYPPFARHQQIDNTFYTVMDLAPTIYEMAGVQHPGRVYHGKEILPLRGKSLLGYFSDRKTQEVHDEGYTMGWELAGNAAVRKGNWKITFVSKPKGPETWQLYDISKDPGEVKDLAEAYPEKLQELVEHWNEYQLETGVVGLKSEWDQLSVPDSMSDDTSWMKEHYEKTTSYNILSQIRKSQGKLPKSVI